MPSFTYCGASSGMYPMARDAYDVPLGTVKPGDVIERDEAPDADWRPYEPERDGGSEPEGETQDQPDPEPGEQDDNEAGDGQEEG